MILNETVAAIADAIREKKGNSELIKPIDFATEIKGITAGGGSGESGGSNVEYIDVTNVTAIGGALKDLLFQMGYMLKASQTIKIGSVTIKQGISPSGSYMAMAGEIGISNVEYPTFRNNIIALSINFSDTINMQGQVLTIGEMFAMYGVQTEIDAIPRLTKEQFYDLNA